MQKSISIFLGTAVLGLAATAFLQHASLRDARERLTALETRDPGAPQVAPAAPTPTRVVATTGGEVAQRLDALEQAIAQLTHATESLMERGQLALSSNKLEELQRRFLDPSVPDKERLQALRLLRRNKGFSDEVVQGALGWLQSAKDADLRRDLLRQLDGATNSILRQPLLAMAASDPDPKIRAEAVQNLRHLVGDADIEGRLWDIALKDADSKVREQAQDALRTGQMSAANVARFQQQASNPQTPLEDRLHAMKALVRAGADVSGPTAVLAQLAQNTTDPGTRARVFHAFDGGNDPAMLSPLVGGLQDTDPSVRKAAADALSGFGSDPRVRQWLEFVAQSDADTRVRREAQQALREMQKPR